jgi:hypothetical protein
MHRETKETRIDDYQVRVTPHAARAAVKLLAKIGRVIGPGLAKLKTDGDVSSVKDMELDDLGPAIAALFTALDDASIDILLADIFKHTSITKPDIKGELRMYDLSRVTEVDDAFGCDHLLMLKVVKYALEVNFGSFFGDKGLFAQLLPAAAAATVTNLPSA